MFSILVVEDDARLDKLFCGMLRRNGYHALSASDGREALTIFDHEYVDLVISDIMMPNMDGYALTQELRDRDENLPILMITAKETLQDKQRGFTLGADDYMVKPIDVNEMILRVGSLLRRAKIAHERKIEINGTILDYDSLTVCVDGEEIILPQKEFQLIFKLLSYPGRIFTRQQLMDELWGMDSETDDRTVDVHVSRLRDHLKDCRDFEILTVRGLGYKAVRTP